MPSPITSELLQDASDTGRFLHGFFTREGGVSDGIYAGLNVGLGSADLPANILENRRRVTAWFNQPAEQLSTLYQVHSAEVIAVDAPLKGQAPKADGLVTKTPGIVLGVLSADCGPLLFADKEAGVVGAAHAGWKGAFTDIAARTIEAMEALGARRSDIVTSLGPSISASNYEVGPEFVERFTSADHRHAQWFSPSERQGHAMFDLQGFTIAKLNEAGVAADLTGHCTYEDEKRFYSYRRTTHRQEPDYGRQISAITLTGQ